MKSLTGVVWSKQLWLTVLALLLVAGVLTAASGMAPQIAFPRLNVFADIDTARAVAQVVLLAQAPLMAISLAVMVFIVGGVQRRDDLDDPLYEWFLAKSFVIPVFFATIVLSLAMAAAFFLTRAGSAGHVANLAAFSGASLGAAVLILLAFVLRALHVLRPGQYRQYKRDATIHQVTIATRAYLSYTVSLPQGEMRSTNWTTPVGVAADRAVQRIIDDAERAIRGRRYSEFQDSIQTIEDAVQAAVAEGLPDPESPPRPFGGHDFLDWPLRRPLRHGLARLSDTAFREDRDDFALIVHDLREEWLRKGILQNVPLLAELAITSLLTEYAIACKRANGDAPHYIGTRTSKFLFKCLREFLHNDQRPRSDERRYRMSSDLVCDLQRLAAMMLVQGDDSGVCEWLTSARNYQAQMAWVNRPPHEIGSATPNGQASLLSQIELAMCAVGGRAVELDKGTVSVHILDRVSSGGPPVFTGEQMAANAILAYEGLVPAVTIWEDWLRVDERRWPPGLSTPDAGNRYVLLFYLWFALQRPGMRKSLPVEQRVVSDMRGIYRDRATMLLATRKGDPLLRRKHDHEMREWLGMQW